MIRRALRVVLDLLRRRPAGPGAPDDVEIDLSAVMDAFEERRDSYFTFDAGTPCETRYKVTFIEWLPGPEGTIELRIECGQAVGQLDVTRMMAKP